MPAPRRLMVAVATLALLVAAGCGGGDADSADSPNSGTMSAPSTSAGPTSSEPAGQTDDEQGAPAEVPDELRFTAETVDGKDFDGASLAGKPAVLWFWAPWCPNCQAEAPGVARVAAELGAEVTFVGVAAQDQVPAMQDFVDKYSVDFTHIADVDAAVWRRFGITYQPAYAFIDAAGSVDVVKQGLSEDDLADRVAELTGSAG